MVEEPSPEAASAPLEAAAATGAAASIAARTRAAAVPGRSLDGVWKFVMMIPLFRALAPFSRV
jgi:hypothetical protein